MILKQFESLQAIFYWMEEKHPIYAADILLQLYRKQSSMDIQELIGFFRKQNRVLIWETLMLLKEQGFIEQQAFSEGLPIYVLSNIGTKTAALILNNYQYTFKKNLSQ